MNNGYEDLAIAIVALAVKDLQDPEFKEDAEKFLKSEWCSSLLGIVGTDLEGIDILRRSENE